MRYNEKNDCKEAPMDQEVKRTLAYLCPACRQSVAVERTVFQLAASANTLPCPCGKSALKVELMGDRARLSVPCLFCGRDHTVTCSTRALLHQPLLAFSCAASGLDCCLVGEEGAVFAALRRLEEAADKLEAAGENRGAFLDPVVMEEVLAEVKDIAGRGGVSCTCGSTEWTLKVNFSSADLTCARCGGALRIPAATDSELEDICCKNTLQIHEKKL